MLSSILYFTLLLEQRSDGKTWLEHGCIIFSQYYDTTDAIAEALAKLLPEESVGVYAGIPIQFVLYVRRFFCDDESCARTTFVEQLTDFLRPYAQRTNALNTSLQILGLALGGEAGASLGIKLGLAASADTILRRGCRRTSLQPKASPIAFCYDQ